MVACYGQVTGAIAELSARVRVISIRVPTEVGQKQNLEFGVFCAQQGVSVSAVEN